MGRFEYIKEKLAEANPDALLADGFEDALIGTCERFGQPILAAYRTDLCIAILMSRDGMTYEDAVEFFNFNTIGAWVGENTPVFLDLDHGKEEAPDPEASAERDGHVPPHSGEVQG